MPALSPDSKPVRAYYTVLARYAAVGAAHEQAVKTAFHDVLQAAAGKAWTLIPEFNSKGRTGRTVRYDGVLRDEFRYTLGYWEAKDSADDLDREIQRKIERGYSLQNTIFQAPGQAVLYQDRRVVLDADLNQPERLVELLDTFFRYQEPEIERFHAAVAEFKEAIPDLAAGLRDKIEAALKTDDAFKRAFGSFVETVRESVNPNIAAEAVEDMLIQHLLTERVVRTVFDNPDFARRNAIAVEIEKVIDALTARHMSRTAFLGRLDRFYRAIEEAADGITDWAEKQDFLNTVYEQFFQGFSDRVADTHGIVYTPQPLVDFMVQSVDALLERHFGQKLADEGVHVLDPFVGTGNFLVRVIEQIPAPALPAKYAAELHANEVMLLPYYVASLNIEHAFRERVGRYEPFPGIVLVDTFEMMEGKSLGMFSAENSERAQRQRQSPIKVILGNPPYNAHQVNANDANQNRKYPHIDKRIKESYVAASEATLLNTLYDPYVRAFRWASDRIGDQGVVAYVTNNSFVESLAFDGMRRHLTAEFDEVYIVNLGGNVRKNPKLSGTTHNVFGIQVGVAIAFLVRTSGKRAAQDGRATLRYVEAGADWKKGQKYDWLSEAGDLNGLNWRTLEPNARHLWLTDGLNDEWEEFLPLGDKVEKFSDEPNETALFNEFGNGVKTNNDAYVFDFDRATLAERAQRMVEKYNAELDRWKRAGEPKDVRAFLTIDERVLKFVRNTIRHLKAGRDASFQDGHIRRAMYRPFVSKFFFADEQFSEDLYRWSDFLPGPDSENRVLCLSPTAYRASFSALMLDQIGDLHLLASADAFQYFPFYVYRPDGTRVENLTDWALTQFQARYPSSPDGPALTKWDVFHYAYAVLHHPAYRTRYAADLKRSLPRLPFAPEFWPFAEAGNALADLHVGYETGPAYPLALSHQDGTPLTYRVEKMVLDKDAGTLRLNDSLTLTGIPDEAHRYRLGNRSALEWLVDQLRVKTDKRSGITHDPNASFQDGEIVDLIRRVTHVSVETVRIVEGLPGLGLPEG